MGARPRHLHAVVRGDVLWLELDTPGSSVNVFGPEAATELHRAISSLPREGVGAVVLASRKPGSFVNGARLLFANALASPRGVIEVSRPYRDAFEALAEAPVPTVALIAGSCFGCGLELALCCDVRIGRDGCETEFVMTELRDYRLLPVFGGVTRLCRTVGPAAAADLLVRGARWDAATAKNFGLLDAVLPARDFTSQMGRAIDALRRRPAALRERWRGPKADLRRLVADAPPLRRPLVSDCLRILGRARRLPLDRALAEELRAAAQTVPHPRAKRAMSFFFVRHMARAAGLGFADRRPPVARLACDDSAALAPLARLLAARRPAIEPRRRIAVRHTARAKGEVEATAGLGRLRRPAPGTAALYQPSVAGDGGVFELTCGRGGAGAARAAARYLEWIGAEVVLTRPASDWVSNRLIARYLREMVVLLGRGRGVGGVNRALWEAGFDRPPAALIAGWGGPEHVAARAFPGARSALDAVRSLASTDRRSARASAGALWVVSAGLVVEVAAALASGELTHPAQGDVLVRLLFDFPLEAGSLLRMADRVGLRVLFRRARAFGWAPRAAGGPSSPGIPSAATFYR